MPFRNQDSPWTEARVDYLRKRWSAGDTANQIAAALADVGITRNSVLAKVNRLGLEPRGSPIKRNGEPKQTPGRKPYSRAEHHRGANTTSPARKAPRASRLTATERQYLHATGALLIEGEAVEIKSAAEQKKPAPKPSSPTVVALKLADRDLLAAPIEVLTVAPLGQQVTMFEMGPRHCKFPVTNDYGAALKFCGEKRCPGSVYCPDHHDLAYIGTPGFKPVVGQP